jgi:hypothetical protein
MDRDWTTGDLCSMHKGLAEFLNDEERNGNKCVYFDRLNARE